MTLSNSGPDASGIIGLIYRDESSPPDPGDARFPFLKFDEKAVKAAFDSLQEVVAGDLAAWVTVPPLASGDDAANIQQILLTHNVRLLPFQIYNFFSSLTLTPDMSGHALDLTDAIISGEMTSTGGSSHSLIFAQRVLTGIGTTIADAPGPALGQNVLNVVSGAFGGGDIEVAISAGLEAVKTYFHVLETNINQLTLDNPIVFPFVTGNHVRVVQRLQNFTIIAEGTVFTGGGDRAISLTGAGKVKITGKFTVDTTFVSDAGFNPLSGGVELIACTDCSIEDGYVNGFNPGTNLDVFDIGFHFASCVRCTTGNLEATNCTVANILTMDCAQCVFQICRVYDSETNLATGIAIDGTAAANPQGCIECDFYSIHADNFFNGWGMNIIRATRCNFYAYHGWNEGLLQFAFSHAEDLYFGGITLISSAAGAASGFNQGVIIGDGNNGGGGGTGLLHRGTVIDSMTLIDCGSTVGPARSTLEVQSGCTINAYVQRNPTVPTTRGAQLALLSDAPMYLSNVTIETSPTGAGCTDGAILVEGELGGGANEQRTFIKNASIKLLSANDKGIGHTSAGVFTLLQLTDVEVLNPNAVGGTSGYVGGSNTGLRQYGRINFAPTATPITANQNNRGTFVTAGAGVVGIPFTDIKAQEIPKVWMLTAAGTPAPDQTIAVTGLGFNFSGKALDTSTRAYEI